MAKCPHCEGEVALNPTKQAQGIMKVRKEVVGVVRKEVMYSCPHCDRVLGFAFFRGGLVSGRP